MGVREPVAMEIPLEEGAAARVPPRIRRRLLEGRTAGGGGAASAEEIEARLKEAEHRRQQFYDWLSSKARKKPRSPSWSSQEEDYGQRLEDKLQAAEQKRLSLLAKAQNRLAKLDELRQAAKNVVEMRFEKEKEELETRVESRVRQAEENRMRLLNADMQRRAALKERTAKSLVQKATSESKHAEQVRSAILKKRAAAEKKRMALLEAEKRKAQARLVRIQRAAETVCSQRETERIKLKEHLESKLQRAKRKRAEYLKQRGSPRSSAHADYIKHADFLSRKLARCWRKFVQSQKTTLALVQAYDTLGLNEKSVKSMPFEELAMSMESPMALEATKALLERLDRRLIICQSAGSSSAENIDHLLKRLVSPKRKTQQRRTRVAAKRPARSSEPSRSSRYSLRVVLCAYMILAHPGAVLSGQGEQEKLLMDSAANYVREFELLVKTVLEGPERASRQPSLDTDAAESSSCQMPSHVTGQSKFRTQLVNFDKAWCSYLYRFVVWKVKDARSLEGDLVRASCKLELSMMQTCKLTADGQSENLTHDMKAIQKQVTDDQKLLREKVQHLSGDAGIERMNSALSDMRSKFFEAKENGSPLATPVANVSTPLSINPSGQLPPADVNLSSKTDAEGSRSVVRSLFGASSSNSTSPVSLPTENEQMVNEMLHENGSAFAANSDDASTTEKDFQARVKETMEKAFWDLVTDSMKGDKPDYSKLINLVKEVRDSLLDLAPKGWKEEILGNIDVEILTQVLESGSQDTQYLGHIMRYSLDMVRKLSAAAKEDEMKRSHEKLLSELAASSEVNGNGVSSFVIAVIKGLRFTLEQIKELQAEVSKARIQMMQPMIKGSAGVEYLQKAFGDRYGPPAKASTSLPATLQWVSASKNMVDAEWSEHLGSLSVLPAADHAQPFVTVLRAGHGAPGGQTASLSAAGSSGLPECTGQKVDKLVRIGLLQLIGGMEGLKLQSTPESFHLNFMRLRTVQGQFQEVIVMATSMLVLRQVLMSENPMITPLELENIISELFGTLVKLLDNTREAGTEEIVEAMMSSSASAGTSSEEKIQSRRQIITQLVDSMQSGFIKDRSIVENFAAAIEMVQAGNKLKKPVIVLKLDFQKAFDSIHWEAILHTLEARGFPAKWINWVKELLKTSQAQMLINGQAGRKFNIEKGVRQGDPLSPYIFIIMADILQQMFRKAYGSGFFQHPIQQGSPFPALQYADDTLLILQGTAAQATYAKQLLDAFSKFTGLHINYHKSTLVPMHMSSDEANAVASILGCPIMELPCTYLGLPLSASKISRKLLQPVIDKIHRRLPGWMPMLMSSGGRIQMINSVLSAIPNFFMACIQWDQASIEAVDRLRRAFLWKNRGEVSGGHCLVAWDVVTMPRAQGGLGIRNLRIHNKAIMAHFTAKLLSSGSGPCFSWLATWYFRDTIPLNAAPSDSHFWKSILQLIPTVQSATYCHMNPAGRTAFWYDKWTKLGRLYLTMPVLFSFAVDQQCTVSSQFNGQWDIKLLQPLSHSAELQLQALLNELANLQPDSNDHNATRLMVTTGKVTTTKDFYKLFSDRGMIWEKHKWVWHSVIPLRHRFFLWLAYRGRLNTKDNMAAKCWCNDAGCDQCPALESIHHIALHCRQSCWVWEKLGLASQAASANTLCQFVNITSSITNSETWAICVAACIQSLWMARNDRVFNNKRIGRHALLKKIASELKLWASRSTKMKPQLLAWAEKIHSL